jgi:hypothetical protein
MLKAKNISVDPGCIDLQWFSQPSYLRSLTPAPIKIDREYLKGELTFKYNSEDNYLVISFNYEEDCQNIAPLVVYTEIAGKQYRHVLFICDDLNKIATTALFKPEYNVYDGIKLCNIESLVKVGQESNSEAIIVPNNNNLD